MKQFVRFTPLFPITAFVLISCQDKTTMPGRGFEGKIVQEITIDASAMANHHGDDSASAKPAPSVSLPNILTTLTMQIKGEKIAYDMSLMGGFLNFRAIIDANERTMTTLMNKHAYVMNFKSLDSIEHKIDDSINHHPEVMDSLEKFIPKPTGMKKTILGLECEEYIGTMMGMTADLWVTEDTRLKFYNVMQDALLGKHRTGTGGLEQILSLYKSISGNGKMPVLTTLTKDGKTVMKSELKSMSSEKISDETFQIPKDFEVVKK
ncbi:MAG: DUF4412 domain-containing protein [bacterium]